MNFLAHIYLSGDCNAVKIGNFIADTIHGKKYLNYPPEIQKGILLHRAIDTFTDAHFMFKQSTQKLHQNYGHYSGVIVDIFYDHFLAKNWEHYSDIPLAVYAADFYKALQKDNHLLPDSIKRMMPYMIGENWLYRYTSIEGIAKVLDGMNRRTRNRSKMNLAIAELERYYNEFEKEFTSFFQELISFSHHKLTTL